MKYVIYPKVFFDRQRERARERERERERERGGGGGETQTMKFTVGKAEYLFHAIYWGTSCISLPVWYIMSLYSNISLSIFEYIYIYWYSQCSQTESWRCGINMCGVFQWTFLIAPTWHVHEQRKQPSQSQSTVSFPAKTMRLISLACCHLYRTNACNNGIWQSVGMSLLASQINC